MCREHESEHERNLSNRSSQALCLKWMLMVRSLNLKFRLDAQGRDVPVGVGRRVALGCSPSPSRQVRLRRGRMIGFGAWTRPPGWR